MTRAGGFTLLEVLVALTLFALVGGSLLALTQSGLRATTLGNEYTHAALLARSKLTELQVYTQLKPGMYEGEFDERYRWRVQLSERTDDSTDTLFDQMALDATIAVAWGEGTDQKTVDIQTVLLAGQVER